MKSAYELAMERLEKQSPSAKVTDEQRAAIAEIDSTYKARIAEREVFLQSQLQKAVTSRQSGRRSKKSASSSRARCGGCRKSANTRKRRHRGE